MPLPDGQWLSFATALPETGPAFSRQFLVSMADHGDHHSRGVGMGGASRDGAVCRRSSAAAERLGNDLMLRRCPRPARSRPVKPRARSTTMQVRLRSLIENRTRMLAAISHDLRTPLTLLTSARRKR